MRISYIYLPIRLSPAQAVDYVNNVCFDFLLFSFNIILNKIKSVCFKVLYYFFQSK